MGFFTYGMGRYLTGIGQYAYRLTYALRDLNPRLELILVNPYPDSTLKWFRDFPTFPVPTLRRLPAVLAWGSLALASASRRLKLDIFHDPCGIAPFLGPFGTTQRVVTVHDAIPYLFPHLTPTLTRLVFATTVRSAKWTSQAVITVSDDARQGLMEHLRIPSHRIFVTPLGVDYPKERQLAAWQSQSQDALPYFLYVGAVNPRKNLGQVLKAFSTIRQDYPDAKLVIAGPPPQWNYAEEALVEELADNLRVIGYVDGEQLHRLYAGALALVFPSLYEGFGLPALEAMAHGTPVITSNRSALPEVVGEAAILVDPLDTDAIATAMRTCLSQSAILERLRLAGRQRAALFSWHTTARKTLAIYRQLMRDGKKGQRR
ncbi:MAG: glycosyltransferase family 4 protein [Acidithiobacillus sp.]|nr:glycosyltransferase family 4 protein [Acidithiobacillus sp.]